MKTVRASRKWILAQWSLGVGIAITLAGAAGVLYEVDGAGALVTQGASLITATLAVYGAANVAQKKVVK